MFNRNKQSNSYDSSAHKPATSRQAIVPSAANSVNPSSGAEGVSFPAQAGQIVAPSQAALSRSQASAHAAKREENSISILVDEDSGIEYYMETIDIFAVDGRLYVAMFPVPEKKQTKSPQLVLLRIISGEGQVGQTMYESIRDKEELARVFDTFFARYENSFLNN